MKSAIFSLAIGVVLLGSGISFSSACANEAEFHNDGEGGAGLSEEQRKQTAERLQNVLQQQQGEHDPYGQNQDPRGGMREDSHPDSRHQGYSNSSGHDSQSGYVNPGNPDPSIQNHGDPYNQNQGGHVQNHDPYSDPNRNSNPGGENLPSDQYMQPNSGHSY
ncbi:MAG: hypothetical protein HYX41_06015 [Bdellovibrio sp.]|nr:hypothetical protein [Bdellovibrio sp.]